MKIYKVLKYHYYSTEFNTLTPHRDYEWFIDDDMMSVFRSEGYHKKRHFGDFNRGWVYAVRYIGVGKKIKERFGECRRLRVLSVRFCNDNGFLIPFEIVYQDIDTQEYIILDYYSEKFERENIAI